MAGLAVMKRLLTTQALTNGQQVSFDLPRDFMYMGILLRLYGVLGIAAGGGHAGVPHNLNPFSYLRKIQIDASGGGEAITLVDVSGFHLALKSHLMKGVPPGRTPVQVDAVSTPAFSCSIPIWFLQLGSQVPSEIQQSTLLNPFRYSKLTLTVYPGDFTDFITGGDHALTWSVAPILDVHTIQAVNVKARDKKMLALPRSRFNFFLQDASAGLGNAVRFSQALPTGNRYRSLYVITLNPVGTGASNQLVDDTLGTLEVDLGPTQIRKYGDPLAIAHEIKEENMVGDAPNFAGAPSVLDPFSNTENPAIGCYCLDFMSGGRVEGLLDARNLPGVGIPVDVKRDIATAAARTWQVLTDEIVG